MNYAVAALVSQLNSMTLDRVNWLSFTLKAFRLKALGEPAAAERALTYMRHEKPWPQLFRSAVAGRDLALEPGSNKALSVLEAQDAHCLASLTEYGALPSSVKDALAAWVAAASNVQLTEEEQEEVTAYYEQYPVFSFLRIPLRGASVNELVEV